MSPALCWAPSPTAEGPQGDRLPSLCPGLVRPPPTASVTGPLLRGLLSRPAETETLETAPAVWLCDGVGPHLARPSCWARGWDNPLPVQTADNEARGRLVLHFLLS